MFGGGLLGEFKDLTAKGMPVTGTENYGGGIVTKGGLFLIAATKDNMFRAFDKLTGKLLWEKELLYIKFCFIKYLSSK